MIDKEFRSARNQRKINHTYYTLLLWDGLKDAVLPSLHFRWYIRILKGGLVTRSQSVVIKNVIPRTCKGIEEYTAIKIGLK